MPVDPDRRAHKIRALLDKAEATPYPAEAEALTAKAAALMASWQITEAMLAAARPATDRGAVLTRDVPLGKGPYVQARLALLVAAAGFQQCRVLTSTGWDGRIGHVVGHAADAERAELLFTSLLVQAMGAATAAPPPRGAGVTTTSWRRNFLLGFARITGERLDEVVATAAAEAEASAGSPSGPPAASVALVLAERLDAVDAWIAAEHGRLPSARAPRASSDAGWSQGRAAGARADLGLGGRIAARERALTR